MMQQLQEIKQKNLINSKNLFFSQNQMLRKQASGSSQQHWVHMSILAVSYWISGLFILSVIFTTQLDLEKLNLYMFISVGVGSLLGGILSDYFNRITIFHAFSCLLCLAAVLMLFSPIAGYIIAGAAIGPMNTLTFVIIMENFPKKSELYTSFVLIGWASSQITLGLMFMVTSSKIFYYILLGVTIAYLISVLTFMEKANESRDEIVVETLISQNIEKQKQDKWKFLYNILPTSLKPLIGGCIFMFVMQMFYYRTQFTLDQFGVSLELNTIVVGITEIIANIILTQFISKTPRKIILRSLIILLMGLFFVLLLLKNKIVQTVLEGFMRLATTSIMVTLGVYLPELFYQQQRGKGCNYIMSFGVLGSALNGIIMNKIPDFWLQAFLGVAFISTFLLHETYRQKQAIDKIQQ